MAVLRQGALRKLFTGTYAPSTLGSFLRAFTFGHVRQLDASASRWLLNLAAVKRLRNQTATGMILIRMDSAYYVSAVIKAAIRAGAMVSVTARMNSLVTAAISTIPTTAWTTIKYTNTILDETTGRWISDAEAAEIPFTAFGSKKKSEQILGRLVVRRIPELNKTVAAGQGTLFDLFRFHTFFTTSTQGTVTADKTHRQHAVIELRECTYSAEGVVTTPD